jgi:excisionase family DNA binding protein
MLVSVKTAAEQLGVSRALLYKLVREKRIPAVKFGDLVRLDLAKIVSALEIPVESEKSLSVYRTEGRKKHR